MFKRIAEPVLKIIVILFVIRYYDSQVCPGQKDPDIYKYKFYSNTETLFFLCTDAMRSRV